MGRIDISIIADRKRANLQESIKRYVIGPFVLDASRLVLSRSGEPVALGPRVVATLVALVERAGDVVTKAEILNLVWSGTDVNESNVAQSVYTLRKVLREHGVDDAIVTVQRRGYRFTAAAELVPEAGAVAYPIRRGAVAPKNVRANRWLAAACCIVLVMLAAGPAPRGVPHPPALSARGAELYRLGRYYWNLRTPSGLAKGSRLFAEVVASDPRSALGHAGLADSDLMIADYERAWVKPARYFAQARAEIGIALALEPDSAAAHTSRAMLLYAADHDERGAEAEFRRAIALDSGYAIAHHWYGATLMHQGRLAEAARELHSAMTIDPISAATSSWLAEASYFDHRYADAIVYANRSLDLDPHRIDTLRCLGLAYELAGDLPRAIDVFKRLSARDSSIPHAPALLAEAYARAGRRDEARAALRLALRVQPRTGDTAFAMLALGDRRGGLALLNGRQNVYGSPMLIDPRLESFRNNVRHAGRQRTSS